MRMGIVVAVLGLASATMVGPAPLAGAEKPEELAGRRAEAWLALVDRGQYDQSWEEAARLFKGALSKAKWRGMVAAVRPPLGKLVSRKVKRRQYSRTLPGDPDGDYVVIQYDSSLESRREAVETVTPMLDPDGVWRVSGYFIR